jgi:hypothetical protein
MAVQQTDTNLGAAIRPNITDSVLNSTNTELANVATRAGKVLGFDATGLLSYTSAAIPSGDFVDVTTTAAMAALAAPSVGDVVQTAEFSTGNGGGGTYDCVTVGTTANVDKPNTYNIIVSTVDATKCFVLRQGYKFNPLQYGCLGDDSTNDTAAWQHCSDFSALSKGVLIVPTGTFILDEITPADNLNVIGKGGTLKMLAGSKTNTAIYRYDGTTHISNIKFTNVKWDGNKANQSGAQGVQACIDIDNCSDVTIESCRFADAFYYAVRLDGNTGAAINSKGSCENIKSINNFFKDCEGNAHQILAADVVDITGNIFDTIGTAGGSGSGYAGACVFVNNSKNVTVQGNNINVCSDSAIYCEDCEIGTIVSNVVYDAAKTGIKWQGNATTNVLISSNSVELAGAQGIAIWSTTAGATRGVISNNIVDKAGSPNTTFAQVVVTSIAGIYSENVQNITVEGNIVTNAGDSGSSTIKNGVYVLTGDNVSICGNTVSNTDQNGVSVLNCAVAKVSNNISYNNGLQDDAVYNGIQINNGAVAADYIEIANNHCYDDQATKTQDYGIRVSGSMWGDVKLIDNRTKNTDHATSGININATNISVYQSGNSVFDDIVHTFTSTDTTPSVAFGDKFKTAGTTAITDFDGGYVGQTIEILADANITITDNAAIILSGGTNYSMTASDTLKLTMFDDQVWQEVSRSVN